MGFQKKDGYDALAVANWFLDKAAEDPEHNTVDHLKLQKLIYIAHGWELAANNRPLIYQDVQAWPYGPVIPSVYHEFKHCRELAIADRATILTKEDRRVPASADFDTKTLEILTRVWNRYRSNSGVDLMGMTHNSDTPWAMAAKGKSKDEYAGTNISDESIKQYYIALARSDRGTRDNRSP